MAKKVKLKNPHVSPKGVFPAGAEIEVPDEEAQALVDGGYGDSPGVKPTPPAQPPIKEPEKPEPKKPPGKPAA